MDSAGGSERLDADLFDLGAAGACGWPYGRIRKGRARHARGSSPRLGDEVLLDDEIVIIARGVRYICNGKRSCTGQHMQK